MHYAGPSQGQLKRTQRYVAVQEAALVDEPKYLRPRDGLLRPFLRPVVEDVLRYVCRGVMGIEKVVFRLSGDQNEAKVNFVGRYSRTHDYRGLARQRLAVVLRCRCAD